MRKSLWATALLIAGLAAWAGDVPVVPFETGAENAPRNEIDALVRAQLDKHGIIPARACSDEVFVRRVYLDVIGTLPEPEAVQAFLDNADSGKHAALIESLLARDEFADYWALKWGDLLRVKAEFPINLWPNAVQAYHRWIHDAIRTNMPYDEFARKLLTSSGSNFREPPVNFYRAVQSREPAALAETVALTLMGSRPESWPEDRRAGMTAFFSRVAFKKTAEWKEEIVYLDPAATGVLDAVFPDGTPVQIPPGTDPREVFADWLIAPDNPWFAREIVNRVWSWLMGRGIVHEPDDIRPDNPPSNPELLAFLEKELVSSHYDLRHIYRLILDSATYRQSSIPSVDRPEAEALAAYYPVLRLDAEVLVDALCWIFGGTESYSSPIPEPFTYIPEEQRTIDLSDGSITSSFLEMFGRPARDTGLESERNNQPSDEQALHLLNSSHIQKLIEDSAWLNGLGKAASWKREKQIQALYMRILSRNPTPSEMTAALEYYGKEGKGWKQAAGDLAWALINGKEFLYRH